MIQKGRKMELIGKGNTAEVFDIGDGKILKLFIGGYPKEPVEREFNNAKTMESFGLPVPACYEMTEVDGRFGIVYEKILGIDLYNYITKTGEVQKGLEILVGFQKLILEKECADLMSYKDFIKLVIGERDPAAIEKIDCLPDGNNVCHGDFHPFNILVDKNGNAKIIDFMNVCRGPRLYDIARSYFLMRGDGPVNPEIVPLLQAYLQFHGVSEADLEPFFEVIAICHKWEML